MPDHLCPGSGSGHLFELHNATAGRVANSDHIEVWADLDTDGARELNYPSREFAARSSSFEPGHWLLAVQPEAIHTSCGNASSHSWTDIPHHSVFLLVCFLYANPHEIPNRFGTPSTKVCSICRLALGFDPCGLFLPFSLLFFDIPGISNPIRQPQRASDGGCEQSRNLWKGLICGVLDDQLCRNGCTWPCLRECRDGHRTAVDGNVADLLGHHERVDELLFAGLVAEMVLLGLCLAVA